MWTQMLFLCKSIRQKCLLLSKFLIFVYKLTRLNLYISRFRAQKSFIILTTDFDFCLIFVETKSQFSVSNNGTGERFKNLGFLFSSFPTLCHEFCSEPLESAKSPFLRSPLTFISSFHLLLGSKKCVFIWKKWFCESIVRVLTKKCNSNLTSKIRYLVANCKRAIFKLKNPETILLTLYGSNYIFTNGTNPANFCLFSFCSINFQNKNCIFQRQSKSDRRSRRLACWPLDHLNGPSTGILKSVLC